MATQSCTNLTLMEDDKKYTISNAMRNFGKDVTTVVSFTTVDVTYTLVVYDNSGRVLRTRKLIIYIIVYSIAGLKLSL